MLMRDRLKKTASIMMKHIFYKFNGKNAYQSVMTKKKKKLSNFIFTSIFFRKQNTCENQTTK